MKQDEPFRIEHDLTVRHYEITGTQPDSWLRQPAGASRASTRTGKVFMPRYSACLARVLADGYAGRGGPAQERVTVWCPSCQPGPGPA